MPNVCQNAAHYPQLDLPAEYDARLHNYDTGTPCEYAAQRVIVGDCVEVMRGMEADSIDAIVCDPPYGLEFMGKEWDKLARPKPGNLGGFADGNKPSFERVRSHLPAMQQWHEQWATEALRVLKPGGHLLAFGGPRTYHRLTCGIEDAGFEIRDCLSWLFGSGFPKSLNIGDGRGTALKPGWEPCVIARKPLIGTVKANVERYGTGALNIDACRINPGEEIPGGGNGKGHNGGRFGAHETNGARPVVEPHTAGRWPANVALDEEAAAMLDEQSGESRSSGGNSRKLVGVAYREYDSEGLGSDGIDPGYGDTGGASRFFYTAKASRSEREAWGRMKLDPKRRTDGREKDIENPRLRTSERVNDHPTVKPLTLMEWLIKLVTPEGGVILDPFCGSGSTLVAARRLNVRAIGIEQDERSAEIARQRVDAQWEVNLL